MMKLPIGEEFFGNIRTKGFYYVDKTRFIADLLKNRGSVNLFTRPRRFGKAGPHFKSGGSLYRFD